MDFAVLHRTDCLSCFRGDAVCPAANPEFSTILSALTELGLSLDVRKTPQPAELYEW